MKLRTNTPCTRQPAIHERSVFAAQTVHEFGLAKTSRAHKMMNVSSLHQRADSFADTTLWGEQPLPSVAQSPTA